MYQTKYLSLGLLLLISGCKNQDIYEKNRSYTHQLQEHLTSIEQDYQPFFNIIRDTLHSKEALQKTLIKEVYFYAAPARTQGQANYPLGHFTTRLKKIRNKLIRMVQKASPLERELNEDAHILMNNISRIIHLVTSSYHYKKEQGVHTAHIV